MGNVYLCYRYTFRPMNRIPVTNFMEKSPWLISRMSCWLSNPKVHSRVSGHAFVKPHKCKIWVFCRGVVKALSLLVCYRMYWYLPKFRDSQRSALQGWSPLFATCKNERSSETCVILLRFRILIHVRIQCSSFRSSRVCHIVVTVHRNLKNYETGIASSGNVYTKFRERWSFGSDVETGEHADGMMM